MGTKNTNFHTKKPRASFRFGFTLVELIVVITILIILGTIGFLQIGNMSNSARDSDRITTMKNLEKWLDIWAIKTGAYPAPEGTISTGLIYGKACSNVWVIGDVISRNIKINQTPLDPLSKTNYTYAVSSDNKYYQVATTLENSLSYRNPWFIVDSILPTAHATSYQAKVSGNYPGYITFNDGTNTYLSNVPSLVFNNSGSINLLSTGTYFVVDKKGNLPYKVGSVILTQNIQADTLLKEMTKSETATLTGINITNLSGALFDSVFTGATLASFNLNWWDISNIQAIKENVQQMILNAPINLTTIEGDPYWANVVLLMHMNGANSGTVFTDHSPTIKTTNVFAHTNTSTAQTKFGSSSAYFDGTDDYISSTGSDLVLGTGDFTIEGWFYKTTDDGKTPVFQTTTENSAGSLWFGQYANTWYIRINGLDGVGGHTVSFSKSYAPYLNKWTHMSLVRYSGTVTAYIDGVAVGSSPSTDNITQNGIRIGYSVNAWVFLKGYIDDYRITKGIARYTSNFTPPTKEFPNN